MTNITEISTDRETLTEAGWMLDENEIRVFKADPLGLDVDPHLVVSKSPAPEASLLVLVTGEDLAPIGVLGPLAVLFAQYGEHDVDEVLKGLGFVAVEEV